ncbi:hypothetical protein BDV93DRAFT_560435 [Ceratobasidium sp. AG-I]|nr:hypothetical protein BDV93DRAFT_560435 [Ceratobasidium sp. AG-I]
MAKIFPPPFYKGYRPGRVKLVFQLPAFYHEACSEHLAFVEWFEPFDPLVEPQHRLPTTRPTLQQEVRATAIVPLRLIRASCHLIPNYDLLDRNLEISAASDLLSVAPEFFLSRHSSYYFFAVMDHWQRIAKISSRIFRLVPNLVRPSLHMENCKPNPTTPKEQPALRSRSILMTAAAATSQFGPQSARRFLSYSNWLSNRSYAELSGSHRSWIPKRYLISRPSTEGAQPALLPLHVVDADLTHTVAITHAPADFVAALAGNRLARSTYASTAFRQRSRHCNGFLPPPIVTAMDEPDRVYVGQTPQRWMAPNFWTLVSRSRPINTPLPAPLAACATFTEPDIQQTTEAVVARNPTAMTTTVKTNPTTKTHPVRTIANSRSALNLCIIEPGPKQATTTITAKAQANRTAQNRKVFPTPRDGPSQMKSQTLVKITDVFVHEGMREAI